MNVLVVEPLKAPYEKEIDPGLESLQHEVGGWIEAMGLDEDACIICNEEGKLNGLELNRSIKDDRGRITDIKDNTFTIEIAHDVRIEVDKAAISFNEAALNQKSDNKKEEKVEEKKENE